MFYVFIFLNLEVIPSKNKINVWKYMMSWKKLPGSFVRTGQYSKWMVSKSSSSGHNTEDELVYHF